MTRKKPCNRHCRKCGRTVSNHKNRLCDVCNYARIREDKGLAPVDVDNAIKQRIYQKELAMPWERHPVPWDCVKGCGHQGLA